MIVGAVANCNCNQTRWESLYSYTEGYKDGNASVKAMLNYFQNSTWSNVTDRATEYISKTVKPVKNQNKNLTADNNKTVIC